VTVLTEVLFYNTGEWQCWV